MKFQQSFGKTAAAMAASMMLSLSMVGCVSDAGSQGPVKTELRQGNAPARPAPVNLGKAGEYAILAKTGISTTGNTKVTGDIGVSPVAADYAAPTPANVTLSGSSTDIWIFEIAGNLTLSSGVRVTLAKGALAKNIFWQVAGIAGLGTTSHLEGNVLSKTAIVLKTGATANGRLLAQTAVTLDANVVNKVQ